MGVWMDGGINVFTKSMHRLNYNITCEYIIQKSVLKFTQVLRKRKLKRHDYLLLENFLSKQEIRFICLVYY